MKIVNLYKYNELQGTVITPLQKDGKDIPYSYRLIADKGMMITQNGEDTFQCLDVNNIDNWYEIEYAETKNKE